jgi:hypothetical protein
MSIKTSSFAIDLCIALRLKQFLDDGINDHGHDTVIYQTFDCTVREGVDLDLKQYFVLTARFSLLVQSPGSTRRRSFRVQHCAMRS